jgi:hypothetical protein
MSRLSPSNLMLGVLWAAALAQIFWPHPMLAAGGGIVLALLIAAAFARLRRQIQLLCLVLGGAAAGLAQWLDAWGALWGGVEKAVIFAAFFGTLSLLRATADLRPEIGHARALVERLGASERSSGLAVGTHILGATLIVGVMAVFAPIVGRDAPYETRKSAAEACQRGMCLACLWSPFWVAMAFSYEHLPDVALWQVMALGLALSTLGLAVAQLMYTPDVGLAGLWRAARAFAPVLPPVAIATGAVLSLKAATALTTLQCLVVGVPALCLAALAAQGAAQLRRGVVQAGRGIGGMQGEIALLTFALALGKTMEPALTGGPVAAQVAALAPPPIAVFAVVIIGMTVLAFAGVHQIVTATVMLVLFGTLPLGIADLALMQAVLLGWAFASMTGLSAVSVAVAGAMFGVPLEKIAYGPNIRFCLVFGVIATLLVAGVNALLA